MSVICVTLCSFFSFFWSSLSRAVIGHGSGAALVPPKMIRRLPRGQKKTSPFGFFCFHTTISIRYGTQREHGMIVFHSRWKQRCQIASDVFFFDLWNHFFTKIGTAFKLSLPTFTEFWWPISEVSLFFFKFGWLEKDVHTEKDGTRKEKKSTTVSLRFLFLFNSQSFFSVHDFHRFPAFCSLSSWESRAPRSIISFDRIVPICFDFVFWLPGFLLNWFLFCGAATLRSKFFFEDFISKRRSDQILLIKQDR